MNGTRRRHGGLLLLTLAALLPAGAAGADDGLAAWREQAAAVRLLAEQDIPRSREEALRLKAALPPDAPAADRARLLNLLARIELYAAETARTAELIEQARAEAVRGGDRIGQIEADVIASLNLVNQGDVFALRAVANRSMELLDTRDPPALVAETMLRATTTYRRFGQVDDSVSLAMENMEFARQSGDPLALTYAEHGLGLSYAQSGRNAEAREHYEQMRIHAIAARSRLMEASALLGLGVADNADGNRIRGEQRIRQAIAIYESAGGPFFLAHATFLLADALRRQGRLEKALVLFNKVAAIHEQHHNPIGLWWTLNIRSDVLQALGRMEAARAEAERAYLLAREIGLFLYKTESAKRLATLAAARGDFREAHRLAQEAIDMAESREREASSRHILELAERFQSEAKQRRIDELTRAGERREAQQWLLWTILAASLLVLAATIAFIVRLRRSGRLLNHAYGELERVKEEQQAVLDAIPDPLFDLGADGRYHHCYSSHPELLAAPVEELVGRTIFEVMPAAAAERVMSALREAERSGSSSGVQVELPVPDGRRWFELSVSRKAVAEGEARRFVVLSRDITARKRAERELTLLTHSVNSSSESLFLANEQGRFVYVNDAACRSLGYSRDELLTMTAADIDLNFSREDHAVLREEMFRGGMVRGLLESRHTTRDGRSFPVEVGGGVVEHDGERFALAVVRDITERKRVQEALAAREREFRTLAEHMPDPMVRYDRACGMVYCNPAYLRLLPMNSAVDVGKTPMESFPGNEHAARYQLQLEHVIATGEPGQFEGLVQDEHGAMQTHLISCVAERGPDGEVVGALAIGRDVTAMKTVERRLAESHEQLREMARRRETDREEERRHIARELHDELGQYLTALSLNASALKLRFGTDHPVLGERLGQMLGALDRTKQALRSLSQRLRPAALEMGIDSALDWLVSEFTANSKVQCALELDMGGMKMDDISAIVAFRLVQESLTNVAKHAQARNVTVSLRYRDSHFALEVYDDGIGFDADSRGEGSFGLIGMRERLESIEGELEIVSVPGSGTRILARIPVKGIDEDEHGNTDCG